MFCCIKNHKNIKAFTNIKKTIIIISITKQSDRCDYMMAKRGRQRSTAVPISKGEIKKHINNMLENYRRQGFTDQSFVLAERRYMFEQKVTVTDLTKKTQKLIKIPFASMRNYINAGKVPPIHIVFLLEVIFGLPIGYLYILLVKDTLNGELLDKRYNNSKKRITDTNDREQN